MKRFAFFVFAFLFLFSFAACNSATKKAEASRSFEDVFAEESGLQAFSVKSLFSVLDQVGIYAKEISNFEIAEYYGDRNKYTFLYENETVAAIFLVSTGTFCTLAVDNIPIYDSGEALLHINDVVLTPEQISELKKDAKENVYARLKAPSTAEFGPSTFSRDGTQFYISGYVDSQNSFGAMLRTVYVAIYKWPHDVANPLMVEFEMG